MGGDFYFRRGQSGAAAGHPHRPPRVPPRQDSLTLHFKYFYLYPFSFFQGAPRGRKPHRRF